MRTAIFVYQPTSFHISTSETDLEICALNGTTVPLSGDERTWEPGVYKIDSNDCLKIPVDASRFEVITAKKDNVPTLRPTSRASSHFAALDAAALHEFLCTAEARDIASP